MVSVCGARLSNVTKDNQQCNRHLHHHHYHLPQYYPCTLYFTFSYGFFLSLEEYIQSLHDITTMMMMMAKYNNPTKASVWMTTTWIMTSGGSQANLRKLTQLFYIENVHPCPLNSFVSWWKAVGPMVLAVCQKRSLGTGGSFPFCGGRYQSSWRHAISMASCLYHILSSYHVIIVKRHATDL